MYASFTQPIIQQIMNKTMVSKFTIQKNVVHEGNLKNVYVSTYFILQ
jgi:hypothetical protein